jgi:transposase-like protein
VHRFTAFDDSIVSFLYGRGLTVREIQGYLAEAYGTEVSPDPISTVTDGVLAEVTAWQDRPLEPVYPVVFFDASRVKTREDNLVRNKAAYLALGVRRDGSREILGLWIETAEGAKFWMKVFNDLKTRGVVDILGAADAFRHIGSFREPIAAADGLTGMPAALAAVFPRTTLQTCIVHPIRNSLATPAGRTGSRWPPRFARSTRPSAPRPRRRPCIPSRTANGDGSFQPWLPRGGAFGIG